MKERSNAATGWEPWASPGLRSHASLHNAGVDEANAGRWPQAERLFGEAIQADPDQAMSWIAKGTQPRRSRAMKPRRLRICCMQLICWIKQGAPEQSEQIREQAVAKLQADRPISKSGNGLGSALLGEEHSQP